MKIFLLLFCIMSVCAVAQINTNLEHSNWTVCVYPSCNPGGENIPTKEINTFNTTLGALEIGVEGPAYSNALFFLKTTATTANYFQSDFDIYIGAQSAKYSQAFEYDMFAFNSPYEYMFGSECVVGSYWQVWNQLTGQWINTDLKCSLATGWHHIQWFVHRDTTTNCNGYPCQYFDVLGVDNVYTNIDIIEPAGLLPPGWGNDSGIQFQLDINSSGKAITEYFKHINFITIGN